MPPSKEQRRLNRLDLPTAEGGGIWVAPRSGTSPGDSQASPGVAEFAPLPAGNAGLVDPAVERLLSDFTELMNSIKASQPESRYGKVAIYLGADSGPADGEHSESRKYADVSLAIKNVLIECKHDEIKKSRLQRLANRISLLKGEPWMSELEALLWPPEPEEGPTNS